MKYNKVTAVCLDCGVADTYEKSRITGKTDRVVVCRHCGTKKAKGKIINKLRLECIDYTGRDKKKYYKCKCLNCKRELSLNREEILEHKCKAVG